LFKLAKNSFAKFAAPHALCEKFVALNVLLEWFLWVSERKSAAELAEW